jgi:PAS domain S-box-containing protein
MIAILRRLTALDRIAAAYTVVYFAWLLARALGFVVPAAVGDFAFYPLGLVIAWANWRNSRVSWLDRRTRIAWRLLALAALILWVSGTTWTIWITVGGPSPYAAWIDRVAFGQYVLAIAGYLYFPGQAVPRKSLVRFFLDVALIVVAGLVIALYVGLRLLSHDPAENMTVAVFESSFDWTLFTVAAVGCMQKRDQVIRRALILLLASNLVSMVGNYSLSILPAYRAGDPVDGLWFSAWVLRWAAARLAWHHYVAVETRTAPQATPVQAYRSNPFSYVMVGGAFVLLYTQILAKDHAFLGMLAVAAIVMGGVLILRQFAELEENRRLFHKQIERESQFRSLVQNSSDVVFVVNDRGVITYVSPSVTTVFGGDAHVVPGIPFRQLLAAEDAGTADALVDRDPLAPPRFETRMQTAPGQWREIEAVWTDLREDPAVQGIVINCRDVSDRNEIERHLRQTQKLDAVGHLAGGLAHDLNNVLAIIRGYTELLRSDLPDGSPARGDLDQIVGAVDRAAGVTGKVLAFSRKQPGQKRLLDLNLVIHELEPMLRQLMKDRVEVRLQIESWLWAVRADQGQMEQVLVNLVTNARDAMPDGGVLGITTANRTLATVSAATGALSPGDYVALSVADKGTGMSQAVLSRMFEPFFSTKTADRGIGLGLAIVHGIVTDMDGRVLVESTEGQGSTFTVLLPRAQSQ